MKCLPAYWRRWGKAMLKLMFGVDATKVPTVVIESQEAVDAVRLMRGLKQAFPDQWRQVSMELVLPDGPTLNTKRLMEANGNGNT